VSYICADHGWRHQCNPCPYCQGASQPRPPIGGIVGVNSDHYQKLDAENKELKEKLSKARRALEFYADRNTYYCESNPYGYTYGLVPNHDCEAIKEMGGLRFGGKIARQTLKELGDE
jgi:hypothetical protein